MWFPVTQTAWFPGSYKTIRFASPFFLIVCASVEPYCLSRGPLGGGHTVPRKIERCFVKHAYLALFLPAKVVELLFKPHEFRLVWCQVCPSSNRLSLTNLDASSATEVSSQSLGTLWPLKISSASIMLYFSATFNNRRQPVLGQGCWCRGDPPASAPQLLVIRSMIFSLRLALAPNCFLIASSCGLSSFRVASLSVLNFALFKYISVWLTDKART